MSNQHQRERDLFAQAAELAPAAWEAFLVEACGEDTALCRRLREMLEAQARADAFLDPAELHGTPREGQTVSGTVPLAEPRGEGRGAVIGRYRLREPLGEGSFGRVYRAEQTEPLRRTVALKIIKAGMDTREVVARFQAERQALALMDHPNLAHVLDAGATETGRPFFVMELVQGAPITTYCDEHRLTVRERLGLFIPVCRAVQHAHQKGVIHRDLKPSNILVETRDGRAVPKVIDFGVAKALGRPLTDEPVSTCLGQIIGTPVYMSPEQAGLGGADMDTRSDIFSLGVILYELLAGQPPFDFERLRAVDLAELLRILRDEDPPRPSLRVAQAGAALAAIARARGVTADHLAPLLRGDLDSVVMKTIEKDRDRRYPTATALAEDLERHLQDRPVMAAPPSSIDRGRKFVRRHRHAVAAALGIFLAAVIGMIATMIGFWEARVERDHAVAAERQAQQARGLAVSQAERARLGELRARQVAYASDMALAQQVLANNNLGHALALLQRQRPEPGQEDLRGWEWQFLWQQTRSEALFTLGQHADSITSVACSPDGRFAASASRDRVVKVWDLAARKLVREAPDLGLVASYSPKDPMLATAAQFGGLSLWDPKLERPLDGLGSDFTVWSLAFSRDGRRLAAMLDPGQLAVWDAGTRSLVGVYDGFKRPELQTGDVAVAPDGTWMAASEGDGWVRILNADTGQSLQRFRAHEENVTALALSPDAEWLATGAGFSDRTVRVWRVTTGQLWSTLSGHGAWISALAFLPDGRLVSASADQTLRVWDPAARQCTTVLRGHQHEVWALACLPDGQTLVSGDKDGVLNVWRLDTVPARPRLTEVVAQEAWVTSGGNEVVLLDGRRSMARADLPSLASVQGLSARGSNLLAATFSARNGLLATAPQEGGVEVWDWNRRVAVTNLAVKDAASAATALRFSADGKVLVGVIGARRVCVWETSRWTPRAEWESTNWPLTSVEVAPDGQYLAAGSTHAHQAVILDLLTGRLRARLTGAKPAFDAVEIAPDGKTLATCGQEGLVSIWEVGTWKEIATLRGHLLGVHSAAFLPDGKRLVTGSVGSEAVRVWDLATGQPVLTLALPGELVSKVSCSPDGQTLLAIGSVGLLHVWRAPAWTEIAAAEKAQAPR